MSMWSRMMATRQENGVLAQIPHQLRNAAQLCQLLKDQLKDMPDLVIRVFDHSSIRQAQIASWQVLLIGAAFDLIQSPGIQTLPQQMHFGLTHGAFQTK